MQKNFTNRKFHSSFFNKICNGLVSRQAHEYDPLTEKRGNSLYLRFPAACWEDVVSNSGTAFSTLERRKSTWHVLSCSKATYARKAATSRSHSKFTKGIQYHFFPRCMAVDYPRSHLIHPPHNIKFYHVTIVASYHSWLLNLDCFLSPLFLLLALHGGSEESYLKQW